MATESTLKIIIKALDEFSGEFKKLGTEFTRLKGEVNKVTAATKKSSDQFTKLAQQATAFQQLAVGLTAVGASLSAIAFFPVKAAAEFDRALSRVVAVTEGARISFDALKRTASELGRTTRYTATEAAQGMRFLGMAGFDAMETMQAIGPSLTLAAAGQMSLAQSADIATNIMTAMRVPVSELTHVIDVLAKTSTSSNTSVMQMAEALKYTAPLAQSAGVTLEEVAAAIGVLGNNGIQACYDRSTDVLTRSGWKAWENVNLSDELGTINPETNEIEWQLPLQLIRYQYTGKMYHVANRGIDLCVTPDHRMWVKKEGREKFEAITAQDVYKKPVRYQSGGLLWKGAEYNTHTLEGFVQNRGSWDKKIPSLKIDSKLWATFLGWYLSEGSCDYNPKKGMYRIQISQNQGAIRDKMRKVLSQLPFNIGEGQDGFVILSEQLYREVKDYGKAPQKYIPAYAKEWSPELLQILLTAIREGDGDCNGTVYTSSVALRDDLMEVGLKLGCSVRYSVHLNVGDKSIIRGREITAKYINWTVLFKEKQLYPWFRSCEYTGKHGDRLDGSKFPAIEEWIDYDDEVFCAEVPNHLLIVRRNGKAIVSGNSLAGTSLRGMLLSLAAPTKKANDTLARLGVVIARNNDGTIDFIETLKRLNRANMDLADSNAMFLRRSAAGVLALAQQVDEVEKLTKANIDAVRSGTEMYQLMEGNLVGAVILLKSAFDGLLRSFGDPLIGGIETFIRKIAALLSVAAEVISRFPILSGALIAFTGVVGLASAAIAGLAMAMTMLVQAQRSLIVMEFVAHFKAYAVAVKAATSATIAFSASLLTLEGIAVFFTRIGVAIGSIAAVITTAIAAANPWVILLTALGSLLAGWGVHLAFFTKSNKQLIDTQKKLGAELSKVRKEFLDLERTLSKQKKSTEEYAETALKLRTFLLKTAEDNKTLSASALEAAESIDLLTGEFDEGSDAIERFNKAVEQQKLGTLISQVKLFSDRLAEANFETTMSKFDYAVAKTVVDVKTLGLQVITLGGIFGDTTGPMNTFTDRLSNNLRMARVHLKLFAREAIVGFDRIGQLDFSATREHLEALFRSMGVKSKDAIDIYIKEFERYKKAHEEMGSNMLQAEVFKNDKTLQMLRESVNKQIRELDRLRKARADTIISGDLIKAAVMERDLEEQRRKVSEATVKHGARLTEIRVGEVEKLMESYKKASAEYERFKSDIAKRPKAVTLGMTDKEFTAEYDRLNELGKKAKEIEEDINKKSTLLVAERFRKIQGISEEATTTAERNRYLEVIKEAEVEKIKLDITKKAMEDRLDVREEFLRRAVEKSGPDSPMAISERKMYDQALKEHKKSIQDREDFDIKVRNKGLAALKKALAKETKAALQAKEDSITKLDDLRDLELAELKRNTDELLRSTKEYKKREEQINKKHDEKKYEFLKKEGERIKRLTLEELRGELELYRNHVDNKLAILEWEHERGIISLEEYYNRRRELISDKIDAEIVFLREKLRKTLPEERPAVEIAIKIKVQEKVTREEAEKRKAITDRENTERSIQERLNAIKLSALKEYEIDKKIALERESFAAKQARELEGFEALYMEEANWATRLEGFKDAQRDERLRKEEDFLQQKVDFERNLEQQARDVEMAALPEEDVVGRGALELENLIARQTVEWEAFKKIETDKDALREFYHNLEIERKNKERDIKLRVDQQILNNAAGIMGGLSDMAGGIYEASEKKLKAFGKVQKAAAISQTIISTFAAAQLAFTNALKSGIPYVSQVLAFVNAAAAIAAGMARVRAIASQPVAHGGEIFDASNVPPGREVPIKVTAKEWKFHKKSVGHYGQDFFDALRTKSIPKILAQALMKKRTRTSIPYRKRYGEVKGYSPYPRADNIHDTAFPGDYLLPVDSVKYYGKPFMSAVSKGAIPVDWQRLFEDQYGKFAYGGSILKDAIRKIKYPSISIPIEPRYSYAAGGAVQDIKSSSTEDRVPSYLEPLKSTKKKEGTDREEIAIYNITDPMDMDRWAASDVGQRAILNVISSRAGSVAVRRILR